MLKSVTSHAFYLDETHFSKTNLGTFIATEAEVFIPPLYIVPETWYYFHIDILFF